MSCSYFKKPETFFGSNPGVGCHYRRIGLRYPHKDQYVCLNYRITGMNCLHESELSCGITPVIEVVKEEVISVSEFRRLEIQNE